jgi:C4-type Zn-finger protein
LCASVAAFKENNRMICPGCGAEEVRLSRAKSAFEKCLKFLFPISYYRCRKCGRRSKRVELQGRRTDKWASRLVNAIGIFLLIVLLTGVAAVFILNRATDIGAPGQ